MTFLAMLIVNSKERLIKFMFGIVIFIGFVGIKGAAFGLATGGQYTVWGPPETFLEDNNALGLALIIILPLAFYARDLFQKKWLRMTALGMSLRFSVVFVAVTTTSSMRIGSPSSA